MDVRSLPITSIAPSTESAQSRSKIDATRDAEIREKANEFESIFIAEMLSHAGFDKALSESSGFGGEAFSRMLVESYAEQLTEKGGFGLADQIYRQLKGEVS